MALVESLSECTEPPQKPATGVIQGNLERDAPLASAFVGKPPDLLSCPICCEISQEPHLLGCCGHHLCRACVERIHRDDQPCPLCQDENFTSMLDKGRQRNVRLLKVHCSNRNAGCDWIGELGKLNEHRHPELGEREHCVEQSLGCQYEEVECKNGCHSKFKRHALHEHVTNECLYRPFSCQYCNSYGATYAEVQEHWKECECYPVLCRYGCDTGRMKRKDLAQHIQTDCPLVIVECVYSVAGCHSQLPRKDMQAHLDSQQHHHNTLFVRTNVELQRNLEKSVRQATAVTDQVSSMAMQIQTLENAVQNLQAKLEDREAQVAVMMTESKTLREEMDRLNGQLDQERREYCQKEENTEKKLRKLDDEITVLKQKQTEQENCSAAKSKQLEEALSTETQGLWEELKEQNEQTKHEVKQAKQAQLEATDKLKQEITEAMEANRGEIQLVGRKSEITEGEVALLKQQQADDRQATIDATARLKQELKRIHQGSQNDLQVASEVQGRFQMSLERLEMQQMHQDQQLRTEIEHVKHHQEQLGVTKAEFQETEQTLATQAQALRQQLVQLGQQQQDQQLQLQEVPQLRENLDYIERSFTPIPPFHFTVSRYDKRKQTGEPFVTSSFYSHMRGYKFCLRVGIGSTNIVAVYGCLVRGEHDDILRWPFRGRIHVRLRNHRANCNHIEGVITYDAETPETHAGRVEMGDRNHLKVWDRSVNVVRVPPDREYIKGNAMDFVVTRVEVNF